MQNLEDTSATEAEREQYLEQIVQERVAEELQRRNDSESATLAGQIYDIAKRNIATEAEKDDLNSIILEADVQELKRKLQRSTQYAKLSGIESVEEKRKSVIACLLRQPGQSLDCKSEVDDFKTSVRNLQRENTGQYYSS